MMAGTTLYASQVTKRFGAHVAVNGVDLIIEPGGITGLIGPNGSGKTTLLNIMSGMLHADSGRISFGDTDITDAPPHRIARMGVARTFQNLRLFKRLTVFDNVCAACQADNRSLQGFKNLMSRRSLHDEVAPILSFVGLLERAEDIAQGLPLGAQRRLELARAVARRPALLLLDEPAGGMTPVETDRMASLIEEVAARGTTIIMVEHKMKMVMRTCNRIAVLDQGRLIADGTPESVRENTQVREAYMGGVISDA